MRWPAVVCALVLGTAPALPRTHAEDDPEPAAAVIVQRALERARWADEQGFEARYACRLLSGVEEEDGERRTRLYALVRIEGRPFYRLLEVEGGALDADEQVRQRKREETFREQVAAGRAPEADSPEDDDDENLRFDEDLVSRYDARLLGREVVEGRPAWLFAYQPKQGRLPEKRRIDKLLNRSRGRIWFDAETYEVARLEFELVETVRFLWFLGSVSELSGHYVRRPVDGVWLPGEGEMTIRARRLLSSIQRRHTAAWSDYAPFPAEPQGRPVPAATAH
jgi:hypothetical protein